MGAIVLLHCGNVNHVLSLSSARVTCFLATVSSCSSIVQGRYVMRYVEKSKTDKERNKERTANGQTIQGK